MELYVINKHELRVTPVLNYLNDIFNKREKVWRVTGFRVWFCLKLSSRRRDCSFVRRSFLRGGSPLLLSSSSSMFDAIQSSSRGTWFMSNSFTVIPNSALYLFTHILPKNKNLNQTKTYDLLYMIQYISFKNKIGSMMFTDIISVQAPTRERWKIKTLVGSCGRAFNFNLRKGRERSKLSLSKENVYLTQGPLHDKYNCRSKKIKRI